MKSQLLVYAFLLVIGVSPGMGETLATAVAATPKAQAQSPGGQQVMRHSTGSFAVVITPESETRFSMSKTFNGGMVGTSKGTMLGDTVVTAYVALEKFEGVLDGRTGSFLMLHRGFMSKAEGMNLDIFIAPNSGTGDLTGIRGNLTIKATGNKHNYDLVYSLPSP
jgi:hypothetical protein